MPDEGKIAKAVAAALSLVGDGPDRFVRLMEYLAQLEADSQWTLAEISLVQTRVSQKLAEQDGKAAS